MFEQYKEQIEKLYNSLGFDIDWKVIENDIRYGYLTVNISLVNNKTYLWYLDHAKEALINVDTYEVIDDVDTISQLFV